MSDLISLVIEIYLDIKYWFDVKRRRKFEKENNLPKKYIFHPLTKVFLVLFFISVPIIFISVYFKSKNLGEIITKEKITNITTILESEKKQLGKYPSTLKKIIRNNPLRKNIILDYWKNEFVYTVSKNSLNYQLVSLGKDRILNTSDDISSTNK